ncbi:hypothetical protein HII36_26490 [Nonomuraea sp. NN258]|uniref:hypothetical protein n=1 Tax=Nonomuraea antri TaxID=2730852 RepID=UPI001568D3B8|nr:hypothetical protein [Nonomuraea antri]NRQ35349.1 hypothetical protein [Nonomuraea antri]
MSWVSPKSCSGVFVSCRRACLDAAVMTAAASGQLSAGRGAGTLRLPSGQAGRPETAAGAATAASVTAPARVTSSGAHRTAGRPGPGDGSACVVAVPSAVFAIATGTWRPRRSRSGVGVIGPSPH